MLCFPYQRDARSFRFPLPNRIWTHHLRYPSFSVLAYLHYRRHRGLPGNATPEELTETLDLKSSMISPILEELVQQGHITPDMVPVSTNEKFFSLPDEVFHLNLGCAAIAIYAFLLYRENRKTYRCTPSYKTIGQAIGASNNTVRKHVLELEAAGLISTDRTVVIDASGRKRNGNLRYTIHPIQNAVELHHQRQLAALDAAVEQQRVKKRLSASARKGGAAQ